VGALATLMVAAGCASSSPRATPAHRGTTTTAPPASSSTTAPPTSTSGRPSTTTAPPTTTTTAPQSPPQAGWAPIATTPTGVAVDGQTYTSPDGSQVTLARFRASQVHYALHVGSTDPPGGTSVPGAPGPAITAQEQPVLLAAFNGGFLAGAGAEGFEENGQVLEPLQAGLASLVIDANGNAQVGVWGQNVPTAGEQVVSVRQNLNPLVAGGQPAPDVQAVGDWGATLGGGAAVARSALGQDAQGNLIYAGSTSALPSDMAAALIQAGVVTGMELDINPEWVQLAVASTPGGALNAGVPGQSRPADQYQQGWTRDFVTVLYAPH
jgi:hypothetical protein